MYIDISCRTIIMHNKKTCQIACYTCYNIAINKHTDRRRQKTLNFKQIQK